MKVRDAGDRLGALETGSAASPNWTTPSPPRVLGTWPLREADGHLHDAIDAPGQGSSGEPRNTRPAAGRLPAAWRAPGAPSMPLPPACRRWKPSAQAQADRLADFASP